MHLKEVSIKLASYILFHCIKEITSLTMVSGNILMLHWCVYMIFNKIKTSLVTTMKFITGETEAVLDS